MIVIIHETVRLTAPALHVQEPDVALETGARGCARTRNSLGDPDPNPRKASQQRETLAN